MEGALRYTYSPPSTGTERRSYALGEVRHPPVMEANYHGDAAGAGTYRGRCPPLAEVMRPR
jgi:hypothetical protein